jgi:hypothetical protein
VQDFLHSQYEGLKRYVEKLVGGHHSDGERWLGSFLDLRVELDIQTLKCLRFQDITIQDVSGVACIIIHL